MEQSLPRKRPSLTEVMPVLHAWLAKQEGESFGVFQAIMVERQHDKSHAVMALQDAKASQDPQTIVLAELFVSMSLAQRRKLSFIWHFYDPIAKVVAPTKPAGRSSDVQQ